jgi:hypothetical protein
MLLAVSSGAIFLQVLADFLIMRESGLCQHACGPIEWRPALPAIGRQPALTAGTESMWRQRCVKIDSRTEHDIRHIAA